MRQRLSISIVLAVLLGAMPAIADDGAGGRVRAGGAGATDDTPAVVSPALQSRLRGDAMAVYRRHLSNAHRMKNKPIE